MSIIGSAYIRIMAMADTLRAQVRAAVEPIREQIDVEVGADATEAIREMSEIASRPIINTAEIRANTDAVDAALNALRERVAATRPDVNVGADTSTARAEIDDMRDDTRARPAHLRLDLEDTRARVRLALLQRTRTTRIQVIADAAPMRRLLSSINRLSGLRIVSKLAKEMVEEFANIDKAVPKFAMMSQILGVVSGGLLTVIGGASTLGSSLVSIVNMLGLLAPAFATGFGVGIASLMVALKGFGKQLPDVVAKYKTLATAIREPFWAEAREPLRDMAMTLFPLFNDGLRQTGGALGRWTASLGDSLKKAFDGNQIMPAMFRNLADSIDIAKKANDPLVESMVSLGLTGSIYLPKLAAWWADVTKRFNEFIQTADSNGNLTKWIDEGIFNLKRLGGVISNTSGFLSGISEAARRAGSDGLGTLLNGITNLNKAVNSPDGLKTLTTIFEGANSVSSALAGAIGDLFRGLASMAPSIKSAFENVAGVLTVLGDSIQKILSSPEFQAGFTALFDGVASGLTPLLTVIGEMGPKFGAFFALIGAMASNVGRILAAGLGAILPLVTAVKVALEPLIPIIGDLLVKAINALAPVFQVLADVVTAIAPVVAGVASALAGFIGMLVDWLAPALPGIIIGVVAFAGALQAISVITSIVSSVKAIVQLLSLFNSITKVAAAVQWAFNAAISANPVGLIIAGIVALVAVIVYAYNNVGWFKDAVDACFKFFGDVVANVVSYWNTDFIPMWNTAMGAIGDFFGAIGDWFTGVGDWISGAVSNVMDFFNSFGDGADAANNAVGDFIDGILQWFEGIGKSIGDAFNGVVGFVQDVFNNISNAVTSFMAPIVKSWQDGWQVVSDVFANIWNGIVWLFEPIVKLIYAIIKGYLDIVIAFWSGVWQIVSAVFEGIWTNLVRFFTPIIQSIVDGVTNAVNWIVSAWNTAWQSVSDFFTTIWNNIVGFVAPIIQWVSDIITAAVIYTQMQWNAAWQGISDFFTTIWNNIVGFVGPIIQSVSDWITNTIGQVSAWWTVTWGNINGFFMQIWSNIVNFVTPILANIMSFIIDTISNISNTWNSTWSAVSGFFSSVWSNIVGAAQNFVKSVQDNINNVLTNISNLGNDILRNVSNFGTLLVNTGRDLIQGLANGISGASQWVVDKINQVASDATAAIKNFFGIKSPSRKMRDEVGKQIGAGLAIGIQQSTGLVVKAAQALADAAVPDIQDIVLPSVVQAQATGTSRTAVSPVITTDTVVGPTARSTTMATDIFGRPTGGVTNVTFQVNPSAGLNEQQIGESAMNTMFWKLALK